MAIDLADAYERTRAGLTGFVRSLDAEALATKVPATPDWSARDVVAHLAGIAGDAVTGTSPEVFGIGIVDRSRLPIVDAHTDRQVGDRRDMALEEVLDEWAGRAQELVPMLRGERPWPFSIPFVDRMVVSDAATHAQDVRNGLGMPGDRDSAGVSAAFGSFAGGLHLRLSASGTPALRIVYGTKDRVLGDGEPAASVEADRYELFRAMGGRRSTRQIRAYAWTGDPDPYLPLIPAYGERITDLEE